MSKQAIIAAVIALVSFIWMFRYDLQTGGEGGSAHVLDRWTGSVTWYRGPTYMPTFKEE